MGNKSSKPIIKQSPKQSHKPKKEIPDIKIQQGLYAIGKNESFQMGIGNETSIKLTRIHKEYDIANIHIGSQYNIYTNNENSNIWVSGSNAYGECIIDSSKKISNLSPITYFKDKKITIKKICVGINGSTIFWITDDSQLFVNGHNHRYQAGLDNIDNKKSIYTPREIKEIRGVFDIQSCAYYSIALCHVESTIINAWMFVEDIIIPAVIIDLITAFCRTYTRIYSTLYTEKGNNDKLLSNIGESEMKWREFKQLKGITITKIKTGFDHTLFLTSKGTVYSFGGNEYGQTAQIMDGDDKYISNPLMITYFRQYQRTKIKDIACGAQFSLALAENMKVFSWGSNGFGQCGNGKRTKKGLDEDVRTPLMIKGLSEYDVNSICCGFYHGFAGTIDGKYFLWGSNLENECMTYDGEECVLEVNLINEIMDENVEIRSVYLGKHNTMFIVENKN